MSRIRQNLFLENTFARFEHINAPVSVKTFRRMSRIRQNLFLENTFARFGHINAPNSGILTRKCAFWLLEDFCPFLFLKFARAYMVWRACVPKSSAKHLARVEFSQKYFVDLIFGHRFLSIFSKFFRLLCKSNRKITKIILCNNGKKREHNGHMFWRGAKSHFLAPKKT